MNKPNGWSRQLDRYCGKGLQFRMWIILATKDHDNIFGPFSISSCVFSHSFPHLSFSRLTQPVPHPLISLSAYSLCSPSCLSVRSIYVHILLSLSVFACIAVRLSSLATPPCVLLQRLLISPISMFFFIFAPWLFLQLYLAFVTLCLSFMLLFSFWSLWLIFAFSSLLDFCISALFY